MGGRGGRAGAPTPARGPYCDWGYCQGVCVPRSKVAHHAGRARTCGSAARRRRHPRLSLTARGGTGRCDTDTAPPRRGARAAHRAPPSPPPARRPTATGTRAMEGVTIARLLKQHLTTPTSAHVAAATVPMEDDDRYTELDLATCYTVAVVSCERDLDCSAACRRKRCFPKEHLLRASLAFPR